MKIVDDKLRIIDDVPSSAVELSVKEKVTVLNAHKGISGGEKHHLRV